MNVSGARATVVAMPVRRLTSPCAARVAATVVTAAAALLRAAPAHAAAPSLVLPNGLTEPTGLVQTPDGSLWVSDAVKGICRIDLEPTPAVVDDGALYSGAAERRLTVLSR
jgi:hypothetical protein